MTEAVYCLPRPEELHSQIVATKEVTVGGPSTLEDIRIDICLVADVVSDLTQEIARICCQSYHRSASMDKLDVALLSLKDAREKLQDAAIELTAAIYRNDTDQPQMQKIQIV